MTDLQILIGDCREQMQSLADGSVQTCITSPPYFGLRDYGMDGQLGRENTTDDFVAALVGVFREVHRVLAEDGTLWLNLGDSYAKDKNRLLIPARVALALQRDGWVLRDEIIWHKPRTTPAPMKDRTVSAHEMLYLFAKKPRYYFDYAAIEEPAKYPGQRKKAGSAFRELENKDPDAARKRPSADRVIVVKDTRRKRSVWSVSPSPYKQAHFATFPPELIEPCVLAGSRSGDTVLDPFGGSGTTAGVAIKHGRKAVLCELNPEYAALVPDRITHIAGEGWDLL